MDSQEWIMLISNQNQMKRVMDTNQFTKQFGVSLNEEEVAILLRDRKESLKEQERVEFGQGILPKIIFTFCDSPYIYQDNYVHVLGRLQDIFYLYKNEALDEVTDDELLEYMRIQFDGICQGSLDHLEDTCLEGFAREIRRSSHGFLGKYEEEDESI
ncbi:DUF6323 family protein [Lachnospiraceae bacterium LCP25S3_G4]